MGCGGSKANAIEPRYYESWTRETETTWLTNTDTEVPQLAVISKNQGKGEEGKQENAGASHRQKKMVNACTQCGKDPLTTGTSTNNQKGPLSCKEVKQESETEVPRSVAEGNRMPGKGHTKASCVK